MIENAREQAKQDLEQRTQEYFSKTQQAKRRKQRQVYNESYERLEMSQEDLTLPQKLERRAKYLEAVRREVERVILPDPSFEVMSFIQD